jgi:hypothetical protein
MGPRLPVLVADQGGAAASGAPGDGIERGAAGEQGVGKGRPAVVLERAKPRINPRAIGGGSEVVAAIAIQVVAMGVDRAGVNTAIPPSPFWATTLAVRVSVPRSP